MKKLLLFPIFYLFISYLLFSSSIEYVKVEELKKGMILSGKTILEGNKEYDFKVKVSGLLEGMFPYGDEKLIIGRIIKPDYFKKTGVIAGMSGSPVYYNGKIVGAVSFTFSFTKEPIAGITPFEYMISSEKHYSEFPYTNVSYREFTRLLNNGEKFLKITEELFTQKLKGIKIPVQSTIPLKKIGLFKTAIVSSTKRDKLILKPEEVFLKDGDPINVMLSTGDVEISAGGTVTKVANGKFYAFGHPFLGLGKVEYPVTKSDVVMVVPTYESSFRLGNSDKYVGKITEDRLEAVIGVLGELPDMIDVNVNFFYKNDSEKEYRFKIVKNNLLSPNLLYLILQGLIQKEVKITGDMSFEVDGSIITKDNKIVMYNDVFSGWDAGDSTSLIFGILAYFLMNNNVKHFDITDVSINITPREERLEAEIANIFVNKYRVKQGDVVKLTLSLRDYNGKYFSEDAYIKVPPVRKGSKVYILAGDADAINKFDRENYRDGFKFPNTPDAIIRALNNLRKNSVIYFKVLWKNKSLFINGYDYSNIPESLFKIMLPSQKDYKYSYPYYSVFKEYALPLNYAVKGKAVVELEVE